MKGIFGLLVLVLVFVIQAAMKCQAAFCSDRERILQQELRHHSTRCSSPADKKSQCCDAEKSSLEERKQNHRILCGASPCQAAVSRMFKKFKLSPNSTLLPRCDEQGYYKALQRNGENLQCVDTEFGWGIDEKINNPESGPCTALKKCVKDRGAPDASDDQLLRCDKNGFFKLMQRTETGMICVDNNGTITKRINVTEESDCPVITDVLNSRHNIDCKPLPMVVRVNDDFLPYFVSLHRCQGSVGHHKPSKKECVVNTSTTVIVRAGPLYLQVKKHTSCREQCIYHKECTENLFNRDENLCLCQCKFDIAPNGCPPNTSWNKEKCKCECELNDDDSKLPKKLYKEKCAYVCPERKCDAGFSLHEDSCTCRLPVQLDCPLNEDNISQGKVFAALVIGEFVVLYLIFDFILYYKKTGLMYYIKCKCWPRPRQPDIPQENIHGRNEPNEGDAV